MVLYRVRNSVSQCSETSYPENLEHQITTGLIPVILRWHQSISGAMLYVIMVLKCVCVSDDYGARCGKILMNECDESCIQLFEGHSVNYNETQSLCSLDCEQDLCQ